MEGPVDMTGIYRHTQFGGVTLGVLVVALAVAAGSSLWGTNPVPPVLLVALACLLVIFSSLTTVVGREALDVSFGPGLIRKRIPLGDIRDVRVVRNPWYYGWGIRLTPSGWLWNVSGFGGVELQLKGGRRFRIGTDEPGKLVSALQGATRSV